MGISINAVGSVEEGEAEGRKGEIITALHDFKSADIVTRPAAGGAFRSIMASSADALTRSLFQAFDYDEWRGVRPDFVQRLGGELQTRVNELDAALTEARAATEAVRATLAERETDLAARVNELAELRPAYERLALAERADAALDGARVPFVHRAALREQLLVVPEAQWVAFLTTQAKLLAAAAPPNPVRGAGPLVATSPVRATAITYEVPTVVDGENFNDWLARRDRRNGAAVATW